jgi:hypothetical protein
MITGGKADAKNDLSKRWEQNQLQGNHRIYKIFKLARRL